MKIAKRISKTEAQLPPCCLRVHPKDHSLILLGTYKLEKDTGKRHGTIEIHRLLNGKLEFQETAATTSAILDLKFSPTDCSILASAHSSGQVIIWEFHDVLSQKASFHIAEESNLVTSIIFSPFDCQKLLATLTSGDILILDLRSGSCDQFLASHTLECWTGAFGEAGPSRNVVFSGGDDASLIAHDLRTMDKIWSTNHRHHDAGVVSILCPGEKWLHNRPNNLWTGSYDDNARIFDLRKLDSDDGPCLFSSLLPLEMEKKNLNGGVWRLVPSPVSDDVLACCMYDGARVLSPTADGVRVKRYFKGDHESMCYGGDWQDPDTIVTCSFYDNVVQAWSPYEEH